MIRKILKWGGIVVGTLIGIAVSYFIAAYLISESRFSKQYSIQAHPIVLASDSGSIARGKHIAVAVANCVECHGSNFEGHIQIEKTAFGRIVGPNLTRGGVTSNFTADDWERAIRHGVGPDGRPLRFMPSMGFYKLSDREVADVVAYIRSFPAIPTPAPETHIGWLLRGLYVAGIFPLLDADEIKDHTAPHGADMPAAISAEYGRHLAETSGCKGCHGDHLSGGPLPGAPPSIPTPRNITSDPKTGIGTWTLTDFKHALREGKRPNGDTINTFMPWKNIGQMHDDEIEALWLYLHSMPAMKFGGR